MNYKTISELISYSVINVDKASGITSRQVVTEIKEIFGLKRCGHTGILDPRVTGVLVVALENATKIMPVLIGLDKEYEGIMYLHKDINRKKLEKIISKHFVGEITQTPPVKSRVVRKARKRRIYYFDILEKYGKNVKFRTKVQAGTYIRKLCSDIGQKLGIGAHMKELRRTSVSHFKIKDSHSLGKIKERSKNEKFLRRILIPIEEAIPHVKRVYVKDSSIKSIRNGAPVFTSDIVNIQPGIKTRETIGIFSLKNKLIALGISKVDSKSMLKEGKKSVIRTDRII